METELKRGQDKTYSKDKNVRWLEHFKKNDMSFRFSNLQPSTDKNGLQNDKIYPKND